MPLTPLQREILNLLAANRAPDNYVAGAISITHTSSRTSRDIDIFHDREEQVAKSALADTNLLEGNGYTIAWIRRDPTMFRAAIGKPGSQNQLTLDWAHDSAFRFFPCERDPLFGYRLHMADIATNKILAASDRREPRDYVDLIYLHENYLSIGAIAFAAHGKDPGKSPLYILDELTRLTNFQQQDLDDLLTTERLDVRDLRPKFLRAVKEARELVTQLPQNDAGSLYLDPTTRQPVTPEIPKAKAGQYTLHRGKLGGHWPTSSSLLSEMMRAARERGSWRER